MMGVWYAIGLTSILHDMKSEKGKAMVQKVQMVVAGLVLTSICCIGGIILYAMFVDLCGDPSMSTQIKYMIFIVLVHGGEMSGFGFIWYQLQAVTERKSSGGPGSSAVSTSAVSSSG